jgi:uncharacterized protein (DUF2147 family)
MMQKLVFSASLALAIPMTAQAAAPIAGKWTNPKGSVVIQMAPCGGAWCGRVVSANAKARADARSGGTGNLIGRNLLSGFKPDGKGGWSGRVFLPKRNMHATGTIRAVGGNALSVKGCALAGVICKEQRWRRVG